MTHSIREEIRVTSVRSNEVTQDHMFLRIKGNEGMVVVVVP